MSKSRLKWCSWCCCLRPADKICGRCSLCKSCCRCPPPCLPRINPMPPLPCMPCMGPPPPPTRIIKEHVLVPFPVPVPMCSPMQPPCCAPWCCSPCQPSCFPCMPPVTWSCGGGDCSFQSCCMSPAPNPQPEMQSSASGPSPCDYEPDTEELELYNPQRPIFPKRSYFGAQDAIQTRRPPGPGIHGSYPRSQKVRGRPKSRRPK